MIQMWISLLFGINMRETSFLSFVCMSPVDISTECIILNHYTNHSLHWKCPSLPRFKIILFRNFSCTLQEDPWVIKICSWSIIYSYTLYFNNSPAFKTWVFWFFPCGKLCFPFSIGLPMQGADSSCTERLVLLSHLWPILLGCQCCSWFCGMDVLCFLVDHQVSFQPY